jgi:hypothetical protein
MVAKSIKHKFVSAIADGTDATLVRPSNWNDDHNFFFGYTLVTAATDTLDTAADHMALTVYNNSTGVAVTLPAPSGSNFKLGWYTKLFNKGGGEVTVTPTSPATINGSASAIVLYQGDSLEIYGTGGNDYVGVFLPAFGTTPIGGAVGSVIPGGGKLEYVSGTSLQFKPFNGNYIKVNGVLRKIPGGGIAGLASVTNVYIGKVAGQNLVASTTYYVSVMDVSGILTANYSRTAADGGTYTHVTSTAAGNEGTEIIANSGVPDETQTLIGIVWMGSGPSFQDNSFGRYVRSWFNQPTIGIYNAFGADETTTSTSWGPSGAGASNFVPWGDEILMVLFKGSASNNTAGARVDSSISIDFTGTPPDPGHRVHSNAGGMAHAVTPFLIQTGLSEDKHNFWPLLEVSAGTGTWEGSTDGWKCSLTAVVLKP